MTDSSIKDQKLEDINYTDDQVISPFYCYCLVLTDQPPSKLSQEILKTMKENWKNLKTSFKLYYVDMANSKCGGKWNSDWFIEKDGMIISKLTKNPVQRLTPITDIYDIQINQQNNDFKDIVNKLNCTLNLTTKMCLYDINSWV